MAITLGDMLIEAKLITPRQFDEALRTRVLFGGKIGTSLIELGYIQEENLAQFLSKKLAVPYVPPDDLLAISEDVVALFSSEVAVKYRAIPYKLEGKRLSVIMADPSDLMAVDEISFVTGYIIKPLVAPEVRLMQALAKYYGMEIDDRHQHILQRIERSKADAEPPVPDASAEAAPEPPREYHPEEHAPAPAPPVVEEEHTHHEWAERMEKYSISDVAKALAAASDREEIGDILIRYMAGGFSTAALFVIRGDAAYGWRGARGNEAVPGFNRLRVALHEPSVLKTVVEAMTFYLGPVPETPANKIIIDALGASAERALILPLKISGRVVAIAYAEGGKADPGEQFAELQKVLAKAALAFEILIFREKILMV